MSDTSNKMTAKQFMSFNLNFAIMMLNCNRDEDANRCLQKLAAAIEQLPEDVSININEEIINA